ncbi:DinB family protein [Mucilaginibacter mali]|uniref:DinB family protein n=1 Tax=Mucilaginibacter mali TaxID=2740462 RepID=A0A7D4TYK2_9SPHI|nr:DinB family protein [Mucilaginibacter mali]QKJ31397.1 DinB family protein [Mucilaginibacter mali]
MIAKPQAGEYAHFYQTYVSLVDTDNITALLSQLQDSTFNFFNNLPADKADYAYAEGKWTIKQLLGHLIDAERVFAFRLLCFSRGDKNNLPGFDENSYVDNGGFGNRTLAHLAEEFKAARHSNVLMLQGISDEQSILMGNANNYPISVRALAYIMAGHELHHLRIIKERYL